MTDESSERPSAADPEAPDAGGGTTGTTAGAPGRAVAPGMEQFQRAALDAVRAARSMLDAAEAVLADPKSQQLVLDSIAALGRVGADAIGGLLGGAAAPQAPRAANAADDVDDGAGDGDGDDGFERITVR